MSNYKRGQYGLDDVYDKLDKSYGTDNILGTVSQSGGVPTGSIIERGSNSDGEYVRFADGRAIGLKFIGDIETDSFPSAPLHVSSQNYGNPVPMVGAVYFSAHAAGLPGMREVVISNRDSVSGGSSTRLTFMTWLGEFNEPIRGVFLRFEGRWF